MFSGLLIITKRYCFPASENGVEIVRAIRCSSFAAVSKRLPVVLVDVLCRCYLRVCSSGNAKCGETHCMLFGFYFFDQSLFKRFESASVFEKIAKNHLLANLMRFRSATLNLANSDVHRMLRGPSFRVQYSILFDVVPRHSLYKRSVLLIF